MDKQPMHSNVTTEDPEPASPSIPVVYEKEEYHWQYKCIRQNIDNEEPLDEARLNELGKEGWELVTVYKQNNNIVLYYFKRLAG